jgi:general stress protein YciG
MATEKRGFASMNPAKQREIASKGGRRAHEKKAAHQWTVEEAREAGRKGGQMSRGGRGRLIVPTTSESDDSQIREIPLPAQTDETMISKN